MPDLVTTIERQIRARVDELKPSVQEYEALERAKEALEGADGPRPRNGQRATTTRPVKRRAKRATAASRRSRSKATSAPKGERSRTILALLEGNPEITAANVAMLLDISIQNAHGTIARLRKQGKVARKGGRWVVKGT